MIDLHTHILPGLDDGVQTIEGSVEFARVAIGDGVKVIIATPHYKEGVWEAMKSYTNVKTYSLPWPA